MSNRNSGEMGIMNPDSRLVIFLDHCTALVLTNFMWLICSIPIVTIGAATKAMYANLEAHHRDEPCTAFSFLRHFKKQFLSACGVGLILMATAVMLLTSVVLIARSGFSAKLILLGMVGSVALITALVGTVVFPLMACTELSFGTLILTAASVSVGFLPRVLPAALVAMIPVMMILVIPNAFLRVSVFWALLGFALVAMGVLRILRPVLNRLN